MTAEFRASFETHLDLANSDSMPMIELKKNGPSFHDWSNALQEHSNTSSNPLGVGRLSGGHLRSTNMLRTAWLKPSFWGRVAKIDF